MHVVLERLMKLNQELHRIQAIYQDVVRQGGEDSNTGVRIKQQMEKGIYYYCLWLILSASYILVTYLNLFIPYLLCQLILPYVLADLIFLLKVTRYTFVFRHDSLSLYEGSTNRTWTPRTLFQFLYSNSYISDSYGDQ